VDFSHLGLVYSYRLCYNIWEPSAPP